MNPGFYDMTRRFNNVKKEGADKIGAIVQNWTLSDKF